MGQTQISGSQIAKRWALGASAFVLVAGGASTALFRILGSDEQPIFYVEKAGNVGIGTESPQAKLEVQGALSGESLYAQRGFSGAGLTDCDLTSQKLLWDASTDRFTCGTDDTGNDASDNLSDNSTSDLSEGSNLYFTNERVDDRVAALVVDGSNITTSYNDGAGTLTISATDTNTTYSAGQGLQLVSTSFRLASSLSGALARFQTVSGGLVTANTLASSGGLAFEGAASGSSLYLGSQLNGAGLTACTAGNKLLWSGGRFSCAADLDTNTTYTAGKGLTLTSTSLALNDAITGTSLKINGSLSGKQLVISQLRNCDSLDTTATGALVCGSDAAGAGATPPEVGTASFSGSVVRLVDARYVNAAGDVMTGSLIVRATVSGSHVYAGTLSGAGLVDCDTSGTSKLLWDATLQKFSCGTDANTTYTAGQGLQLNGTSLRLLSTVTGSVAQFTTSLASSGTLTFEGAASGSSLYLGSQLNGAGLSSCSGGSQKLTWAGGRFGCGTDTDTDTNTTYTAGQGLSLLSTSFSVNSTLTGALARFLTVSGSLTYARTTLASSGTLVFEGAASGSSLYLGSQLNGAGLSSCTGGNKLLWSGGRFSCAADADTDTNTTYAAGQGLSLVGGNFRLNAAHSGTVIQATTTLASSGTLVAEGAMSGASLYVATSVQGAGLTDCDAASQTLSWDASTGRFTCGTDSDTTYNAGKGLSLNGTSFSLGDTLTGTSLKINGALSGKQLVVSQLRNCDSIDTTSTGALRCGTDATGGGGSNWSNTSALLTAFDQRYVNIAGDTMTGGLSILDANSDPLFDILGNGTTSSLTLSRPGGVPLLYANGNGSTTSLTFDDPSGGNDFKVIANATDLDAAFLFNGLYVVNFLSSLTKNSHIFYGFDGQPSPFIQGITHNTGNIFEITASGGLSMNEQGFDDADVQFQSDNQTHMFFLNSAAERIGIANANPKATLDVIGTMSGSGLFTLSAYPNCTLKTNATGDLTCGTDNTGGGGSAPEVGTISFSGAVLRLGDTRYVRTAGGTMTGALTINITGGNRNTLGLNVLNTVSGAVVRAQNTLASSGTFVFEGAGSGSSLALAGGRWALSASGGVVWNPNQANIDFRLGGTMSTALFFLDASGDRVGIGTATPKALFGVLGTMSGITVVGNSIGVGRNQLGRAKLEVNGTMSGAQVTINGGTGSGKILIRGADGAKQCLTDTDGAGQTIIECNNGSCTFRVATGTECNQ